jgi:hypothetical protein
MIFSRNFVASAPARVSRPKGSPTPQFPDSSLLKSLYQANNSLSRLLTGRVWRKCAKAGEKQAERTAEYARGLRGNVGGGEGSDTPSLVRTLQFSVVCSTPMPVTLADPCCTVVSGILNLDELRTGGEPPGPSRSGYLTGSCVGYGLCANMYIVTRKSRRGPGWERNCRQAQNRVRMAQSAWRAGG